MHYNEVGTEVNQRNQTKTTSYWLIVALINIKQIWEGASSLN